MLEETLEKPLDCKVIKPVHPKGNQPWISTGLMLKLKLQYFGLLMQRAKLLEKTLTLGKIEGIRRSRQQRMRWLDSIIDSMDMNLSKLQEIVDDRGAWHATVHGVAKSWTWFSNWTIITKYVFTAKKYFWRPWDVWSSCLNILFLTLLNPKHRHLSGSLYNWFVYWIFSSFSKGVSSTWNHII